MEKNYLIERIKENTQKMVDIAVKKNQDYSGAEPFQHFMLVERLGVTSAEKGIVVRMCDKVSRIANLLEKDAAVVDESIQDTLLDLANYALILEALINYRAGDVVPPKDHTDLQGKIDEISGLGIIDLRECIGKKCCFVHEGRKLSGIISEDVSGLIIRGVILPHSGNVLYTFDLVRGDKRNKRITNLQILD